MVQLWSIFIATESFSLKGQLTDGPFTIQWPSSGSAISSCCFPNLPSSREGNGKNKAAAVFICELLSVSRYILFIHHLTLFYRWGDWGSERKCDSPSLHLQSIIKTILGVLDLINCILNTIRVWEIMRIANMWSAYDGHVSHSPEVRFI